MKDFIVRIEVLIMISMFRSVVLDSPDIQKKKVQNQILPVFRCNRTTVSYFLP